MSKIIEVTFYSSLTFSYYLRFNLKHVIYISPENCRSLTSLHICPTEIAVTQIPKICYVKKEYKMGYKLVNWK